MFYVVTGGSGSGKSRWAEDKILQFGDCARYYVATMNCGDEETKTRIARHRRMRAGKNFQTVEQPRDLQTVTLAEPDCAVLLEDMSNLVANEFFDGASHTVSETVEKVMKGVEHLRGQCGCLIVVTNEIFSDAIELDAYSRDYLAVLGEVNRRMAQTADVFTEVVYGIAVTHKGEE